LLVDFSVFFFQQRTLNQLMAKILALTWKALLCFRCTKAY